MGLSSTLIYTSGLILCSTICIEETLLQKMWTCIYKSYSLSEKAYDKDFKMVLPGFVQSLEFLKKSGNLRTTFPDLEKVWKLKAKS